MSVELADALLLFVQFMGQIQQRKTTKFQKKHGVQKQTTAHHRLRYWRLLWVPSTKPAFRDEFWERQSSVRHKAKLVGPVWLAAGGLTNVRGGGRVQYMQHIRHIQHHQHVRQNPTNPARAANPSIPSNRPLICMRCQSFRGSENSACAGVAGCIC